ncbi:hypothetical protein ACQP2P_21850 [Dactylosporangium sp. CA-139114]|uniref:hypothetical protein n=1 Tax=Dactylosporangium sp. CA-139114 TaxID=3239931 RepID=UPI003D999AF3
MTTTTTEVTTTVRRRVPIAVRGAQLLLLLPLGAFQLVATIVFSIITPLAGKDYIAVVWAPVMALGCIVTALRLGRGPAWALRTALALLAAQTAFSLLKLIAFDESASLVFLAVTVVCAGLLALPASRRHFQS